MIEDEGLYRAILDDPDGDLPRLVYADWLEEQGDSDRAEFIRAQCELARLPHLDPDKTALRARARLCDRSRSLAARHAMEWLGPFGPAVKRGKVWAEFRRGFVGHVLFHPGRDHPGLYQSSFLGTSLGEAWDRFRRARPRLRLDEIEGLFSRAPIQELTISANSPVLAALMEMPCLAHMRRLQFFFPAGREQIGARLFSASSAWPGLRELVMPAGGLDQETIIPLASSRHREHLAVLDLSGNFLSPGSIEALANSAGLGGLRKLILIHCGLGDPCARLLIASNAFPRLTMLDLAGNPTIGWPMRQALRERFGRVVRL